MIFETSSHQQVHVRLNLLCLPPVNRVTHSIMFLQGLAGLNTFSVHLTGLCGTIAAYLKDRLPKYFFPQARVSGECLAV